MERLTKHSKQTSHENGICCTHFYGTECLEVGGNCAMNCKWEEAAWSRLAAYEDTGLEPEICAEYKKFEDEIVASGKTFDHLIKLLQVEKEGRLTVLPGPDSSSVVQCRNCKYSYTIGKRRFCAWGVCGGRRVSDTFFCAYGRYKTNTGGEKKEWLRSIYTEEK